MRKATHLPRSANAIVGLPPNDGGFLSRAAIFTTRSYPMKTAALLTLSLVVTALSMPSFAHDPKEHQKQGATTPDCSKMKDMDASKMDMNDPVMKALHAKCKKQMDQEKMEHDHTKSAPGADQKAAQSSAGAAQKSGVSTIDCSKMKSMDMSKMDMNDPAMKAMHEKCMKGMRHGTKQDDAAHQSGTDNQKPTSGSGNTK